MDASIRGVALTTFGVLAVAWPGITLLVLATLFAVYLMLSGVSDLVSSIRSSSKKALWNVGMLLALAELGVGVYVLKSNLAAAAFAAVVGMSLMVFGVLEVVKAFESSNDGRNLLVWVGALTLVAGFVVLRYPSDGGLVYTWVLAVWALVTGSVRVAMSLDKA